MNSRCGCPNIVLGTKITEQRNWNPDCEEHGWESEWYKSDMQQQKLKQQRIRTTALQRIARERRQGNITAQQAKERIKEIDKAYCDG